MGNNLVAPSSPRARDLAETRKHAKAQVAWSMDNLEKVRRISRDNPEVPGSYEDSAAKGRLRAATQRASLAQESLRRVEWLQKEYRRQNS